MLHNFQKNQRLTASCSDSMSSMSIGCDDDNGQPKELSNEPTIFDNNLQCHDCGRCFERELELRIHMHCHRQNETPSQNNDSQNGFDDQFLIANIKSEPVEYTFDPLDWPDTIQSDADNIFQQNDDVDMRWKCTICHKRFLRRAHLRNHRREHAVDRPDSKPTTSEMKPFKNEKKIIPQPPKNDKITVNLFKKKLNLNMNLNQSADAQFDRWQCKKCFSTFRTRRLLRDHNVIHRNTHQSIASLDFDANLLNDTSGNEPSIIHFDADSDAAVAAATAAAAAIDAVQPITMMSTSKKLANTSSPKTHSTPIKSTNETRWKCPKCRKVFSTPKLLRKHKLNSHTFEIKLNLKSKNFISDRKSVSLSDSMKKKKMESRSQFIERDWPCNSCSIVFNRRNLLREHRRTVHIVKPTDDESISMKQEEIDSFTTSEDFAVAD